MIWFDLVSYLITSHVISFHLVTSHLISSRATFFFHFQIWDPRDGSFVRSLKGHEAEVTAVRYSADQLYLVSSGADLTLIVWDLSSCAVIRRLRGHSDIVSRYLSMYYPYGILSRETLLCITSHHITSCHVMSCHVMSCRIILVHIISCHKKP